MGDSFDQATSDTDQRRKEALEALANGGTAGLEAYKQAQGQIQSVQTDALNQALNAAAGRGASTAAQGELATMIRQPGDLALQQLAGSQATFAADLARRSGANADYFRQVGAAVPLARAHAQAQWANQAAKEAKARQDTQAEQKAIAAGLAEMQAEAERTARARFQPAAVQHTNPTFDPVGAQLALLSGVASTPEQVAQAEQIVSHPMAGSTFIDESGNEVAVEPTAPDPHYQGFGRRMPQEARELAAEIAAARIPTDVQAQREGFLMAYGDDPRQQALARGLFRPPTLNQQLEQENTQARAEYVQQYGYSPSPTQLQNFIRGLNPEPVSTKPQLSPAEAAAQVSDTPDKLLNVSATTQDENGDEITVNVYETVAGFMEHYLEQGYPPEEAAQRVAIDLEKSPEEGGFGKDFPAVRQAVALVYGAG